MADSSKLWVNKAIKHNTKNDIIIDIERKSFLFLAMFKRFTHIIIKTEINKDNQIIHCSNNICTYQFSGKNLLISPTLEVAIFQFQADSIDVHIWLAGQAMPSQYHMGL